MHIRYNEVKTEMVQCNIHAVAPKCPCNTCGLMAYSSHCHRQRGMYKNDYIMYTPSLHNIYNNIIYSCIAYGNGGYTSTQATFMHLS